jgi:hypothetical protein
MNHRLFCPALAAAAVVVLSGCSMLGFERDAPRDADGVATAAARADPTAVKVGDCVQDPGGEDFYDVEIVPCGDPHQLEVFHGHKLTQGSIPTTDDEWMGLEAEMCDPAFAEFVGVAWDVSTLETTTFTPSPESWAAGERRILCLVGLPGLRESSGTLAGSKL